jgi:hypothetical protein
MGQRLRRGYAGFEHERMIKTLHDIALRKEIWRIEIVDGVSGDYRYRIHRGAHRFHASIATGFSHIPAILRY